MLFPSPCSSQRSRTPLQIVLLAIFVLCLIGAICSLTTRNLHRIVLWFAPINVLASISICIALLVLTPNKQSAKWVFTEVTDGSGWGSQGFSFLLGFLSVAWTMTDYDGTTHMSEETHDAAIRGPLAIRVAILVSGIVGELLTITFCFCLTDVDSIMSSPTGLPVAQIFLNAGGRTGGLIMWFFVILVQFFTGCSAMLANARMAYAFARDEALPLSGYVQTMHAENCAR
jgi:amino acid transporter